ncbi:S8 family serine peptidase [Streptomyces sp. NPDC051909]|uniref:S8 family serine peptidase n=1 Tax=Streptomyces sp. NPDC051909 TaxID=3154944 RepID=UPI0034172582
MRRNQSRRFTTVALALLAATASVAAALGTSAVAAPAATAEGRILGEGKPNAIDGSYIVVFKDSEVPKAKVDAKARDLASKYNGVLKRQYQHALRGMAVQMTKTQAKKLAADPSVKYVEQNAKVSAAGTQNPVYTWGLDRIDQRNMSLDGSYTYPNTASNVRIYVIDSGIRTTHTVFGGRATWGTNTTGDGINTDCHGHGTHVAGTAAGNYHGVAKGAQLTAVKVLGCGNSGDWAGAIAGIDWVTGDHDPGELAVANMSIQSEFYQAGNDAITASIADGVTYAVAAGNATRDACTISPASTPNAITVGASTESDGRVGWTNWGSCLDLFAPGIGILSATAEDDYATAWWSGTSMASPHVAGVAAMVLSANPSFTPQQVRDTIVNGATNGVITDAGTGSPNKLLFAGVHSVVVPNVLTSDRDAAISAVTSASLTVTERTQIDNTCTYYNQVMAQSPAAGTVVPEGSAVTLTIGKPGKFC